MRLKEGFKGERHLVIPGFVVSLMKRDSILGALHITDIGYYPKARHHFCERREPIEQHVLIHCVDGRGHFTVNGHRRTVSAGQYFVLPPGEAHSYASDDTCPWTIYWVHFQGELAAAYAAGGAGPHNVEACDTSRIAHRTTIFEEIYEILSAGPTMDNLRYATSLFHHYLGSLRFIDQYRMAAAPVPDKIAEITHFIEENLERRLTLKDVAASCGMAEGSMSALFRRRTGHSVINYMNLLRVQRACELLDNTSLRINQICYKTGIDDPYYFSRLFSKIMGMSPGAFRRRPRP